MILPDNAIMTHRNSVTGKATLHRNWVSLRVNSCFDSHCLEMCISNCSQRWKGSWKVMTKKKNKLLGLDNYLQVKILTWSLKCNCINLKGKDEHLFSELKLSEILKCSPFFLIIWIITISKIKLPENLLVTTVMNLLKIKIPKWSLLLLGRDHKKKE